MANTKNIQDTLADSIEIAFRPRARIMRTLGTELISSEAVALIELVKNAYDADATKVLIRFIGTLEKGKGRIEFIDNGHGMSMETVRAAWMEPATNSKRKKKRSEKLKRRFLGEKGVGRFASSRLADELELITKRETEPDEIYALFDWTQFDDESLYLDQIEILAEKRPPELICPGGIIESLWASEKNATLSRKDFAHGTVLKMNKLNKNWTQSEFSDLQRDFSRLVSPFADFQDFSIRLDLPEEFSDFSKEITPPEIIKYPHYSIRGNVDEEGKFKLKVKVYASGLAKELSGRFLRRETGNESSLYMLSSEQTRELLKNESPDKVKKRQPEVGPFEVELRIWDRDELGNVVQITESTLEDVRRDLNAVAGINIYRDGFRVLPYGEPHDDWLRLDFRRVQKPTLRLSNNQIVGYVSISSDKNTELRDQSNREGLDDNQALKDLRAILLLLLNEIEVIRYPLRRTRRSQPFSKPVQGLFSALNIDALQSQIAEKYPKDKDTQNLIDEARKSLQDQIDEIQVVISRYQRLATLGTLIDAILHDGRHPLAEIVRQSILGQTIIDTDSDKLPVPNLRKKFEAIETQGNFLNAIFDRIEPFGGRKRGRPEQLYLEEIIKGAVSVFQTDIKKLDVDLILPKSQTLVRVDQTEIQQVILNLLNNSLYWLEYVRKDKRKIIIDVNRIAEDEIEMIFADSGPGIPPENKEMIFEPYFSTKPDGVGLGLSIAGEIVSDYYNGKLELIESRVLPGAVFRATLKKRV
jgi:signal transduction histidine kinase